MGTPSALLAYSIPHHPVCSAQPCPQVTMQWPCGSKVGAQLTADKRTILSLSFSHWRMIVTGARDAVWVARGGTGCHAYCSISFKVISLK